MCSHTSSLSSGCGGDNGGYSVDCMYSKKTKRQKVPKRGPGVAELEKILREQEKKNGVNKTKNEGFPLVSPISTSFGSSHQSLLPPPNLVHKNVPFVTDPTHFSVTTIRTALKGNDVKNSKKGVYIGGSATNQSLLKLDSCETIGADSQAPKSVSVTPFSARSPNGSKRSSPSPALMQRTQFSPPSTINIFPHSAVSSSSTTPSGLRHAMEPPSNQISHPHYTSSRPEEDMTDHKRTTQQPLSMEIPPFRCPFPTISHQMKRADPSPFSCANQNFINVEPIVAVTREGKGDGSCLEPNMKIYDEYNNGDRNGSFMILFGSSTTVSSTNTSQQAWLSNLNPLPFQEEEAMKEKTSNGRWAQQEPKGFNLNEEAVVARGDEIDLNLKL